MRPNQEVIFRRCYREGQENGGWRWYEHPATIVTISSQGKTAVIDYVSRYGRVRHRVHISRLREIKTHIKSSLKVGSLQLEISQE